MKNGERCDMKQYDMEQEEKKLWALEAYQVVSTVMVEEIGAKAVVLTHKKTKARMLCMLSEDNNKVFTIGFRTPSRDSTGVAHILEHSVLCGSRKFPLKDPFVELVKGSLNTFLNAITYPDKTIYPVASYNEKDFQNLMDVYLDAVLYPNVYQERKIFAQEGWHYELTDPKGELTINGVVYNEMKGAFSSPDGVLERRISKALFPGHSYGEESGGDPEHIPELTYEEFLRFHGDYYHPSNSFIYLYGDMDMAEKLTWMDEAYLSHFEYRQVDSAIQSIPPLEAPRREEYSYSVSETESVEKAAYLSFNTLVGQKADPLKFNAWKILDYLLLSVPGAPLVESLIDAGLGSDVYGSYEEDFMEPYFSITAKGAQAERSEEFLSVIRNTLEEIVKEGIDKNKLRSAINLAEFRAREADFGSYPKGLIYGMECFKTWLYGGNPVQNLCYNQIFASLKAAVDTDFYENLIRESLLNNSHTALIVLKPVRELTRAKDEALRLALEKKKAALSQEELEKIIEETKALKAYQSAPSRPEDLAKIPMLGREDISTQVELPPLEKTMIPSGEMEVEYLYSPIPTRGINYVKLLFYIGDLSREELQQLALLKEIFGFIDTKSRSYSALSTDIDLNSGGIHFTLAGYGDGRNYKETKNYFTVGAKIFYGREEWLFSTLGEILLDTKLTDEKRIREILAKVRGEEKDSLVAAGHVTALNRAGSYIAKGMDFTDTTKGVAFYTYLEALSRNPRESSALLSRQLQDLLSRVFTKERLLVHATCEAQGDSNIKAALSILTDRLPKGEGIGAEPVFVQEKKNEGLATASQVNYVARVGNFKDHGMDYTGALKVLTVLLSYDYLWNNIRVKGGAYGCSALFNRSGNGGFVSYRDPHVANTNAVFLGVLDFVKSFRAPEREMTKAVIGAISGMDTPMTPAVKGQFALGAYFSHLETEDFYRERQEVLKADENSIRSLAPLVEAILQDDIICAIGNKEQLERDQDLFKEVRPLFFDQDQD